MSTSQVLAALTPEAAAQLDGDGHFVFPEPVIVDSALISGSRAEELARAYWHTFRADLQRSAERQRGVDISTSLHVCPRTYLAESGYDPFPSGLPRAYRRAWGPAWLVGLCSGSQQQVVIAVSAEAADVAIDQAGTLVGARSGDFFTLGVPPGVTIPSGPEYAAVLTANRSGRLVGAVPRLRRSAQHHSAFSAVWTFEIDSPVVIAGQLSGAERSLARLALGAWGSAFKLELLDGNPQDSAVSRMETQSVDVNGTSTVFDFTRRIDIPASWEPVTVRRR